MEQELENYYVAIKVDKENKRVYPTLVSYEVDYIYTLVKAKDLLEKEIECEFRKEYGLTKEDNFTLDDIKEAIEDIGLVKYEYTYALSLDKEDVSFLESVGYKFNDTLEKVNEADKIINHLSEVLSSVDEGIVEKLVIEFLEKTLNISKDKARQISNINIDWYTDGQNIDEYINRTEELVNVFKELIINK